ncbi:MAG: VWA domain-containing protein [Planctomycetia bacterium]|nr:VWA domain-containing protein [Planctomycetia bacterium]
MTFLTERIYLILWVFVLIPVVIYWRRGLAGYSRWRSGLILLLRCGMVVLLTVAMVGPVVTWKNMSKFVVHVLDVSGSIRSSRSFWDLEDAAMFPPADPESRDRAVYLPYARTVGKTSDTASELALDSSDASATDLSAVLAAATALAPEDHVPEVVLYTDGTYNIGSEPRSVTRSVPVKVVHRHPAGKNGHPETWLARLETPPSACEGEVVGMDAFVQTTDAIGELKLTLARNGETLETQTLVFEKPGTRGVRFQAPVTPKPGTLQTDWTVTIAPSEAVDQQRENNVLSAVTRIVPHQRVLLVEREAMLGEKLVRALKKEYMEVECCLPEKIPTQLSDLQHYGLVILSNIPASRVPTDSMLALREFVTKYGGGLMVLGGNQAFTSGGYHLTPVEDILPVVCVEDTKREREGVGLVLVVDRSESMKAGNAIGLAKEAVKRALEVLGPQDQVGVLVYADTSGWVVPMCVMTETNKSQAYENIDKLKAISVTNMAPAMEKAYYALMESSAPRKHIIVMTDGVSNPDDFGALAQRIHDSGITISTIALGDEAEPNVLADIASIGQGNAYLCTDPASMPQIFAAETASAARLGVMEGQAPVRQISSIPGFLNFDFTKMPPLLGYVQTRAKPGSRTIFESAAGDPLLVWWKQGRGKVIAFTSGMESHWIETWSRGWDDFSRFWGRLVTHAMRNPGRDMRVNVTFDDRWMNVTLGVPYGVTLKEEPFLQVNEEETRLVNVAPGLYAGRRQVDFTQKYDVAVRGVASTGPFTWKATTVPTFTSEYRPDRQKDARPALEKIQEETKAAEASLFVWQTLRFWRYFLLAGILVWFMEIGFRRAK